MKYGYKKQINLSYQDTVSRIREELQKEGFGVLTEIDVKVTLKKKLDVNFDNYIILGACNPPFAYKALQSERDIGLLLPCNVIVYEQEGTVTVNAIKPTVAMEVVDNSELEEIAQTIEKKLIRVIDSLS